MTETEICNLALAALGHDRTITSLTDGSAEAARCALFLPGARRAVLGAHAWGWLAEETPQLDAPLTSDGRAYIFGRPAGALRVEGLFDLEGLPVRFRTANGVLLADEGIAAIRYVPDCEDPELWPAPVCDAVAYELAARVAGPMTGKRDVVQAMREAAGQYLSFARAADANESRERGNKANRYADARNQT